MCYSFEMAGEPEVVARRFGLSEPPPRPPKPVLRPTVPALVVVGGGGDGNGGRRGLLLGWGLPASWDGRPLANARAETLAERPSFRDLLSSRCLVPATAYFEWRHQGRNKMKNRIFPTAGGLFALAGLWNGGHFVIITCPPAAEIAHIHNRMPVILDSAAEEAWADPAVPFAEAAPLLAPTRPGALKADEEPPPAVDQPDLFDPP